MRKVTGKRTRRKNNGSWQQKEAKSVLKASGNQDVQTYINRRQATVAQWVALHHIFKVCVGETG